MEKTSMKYRLKKAGIKTIRPKGKHNPITDVFLEYNGKRIGRPNVGAVENIVFKSFGVKI